MKNAGWPYRPVLLAVATVGLLSPGSVVWPCRAEAQVRVTVFPEAPYIKRGRNGQELHVDFLVANETGSALTIDRIETSVLDRQERPVQRKFVFSTNGGSPGLLTIPQREVSAGSRIGIFNPFFLFDADVDLSRVRFEFTLVGSSGPAWVDTVTVTPTVYELKATLRLPLQGRMIVWDGHDFYSHHRRVDLGSEPIEALGLVDVPVRYAYDFCVVDDAGRLYRGDPSEPRNWLSYGAPVYAPAAGVVVSVGNAVLDNHIAGGELIYPQDGPGDPLNRALGNHVVLDHGAGEFSTLAHLLAGSVTPEVGDQVARGERVGAIGFSGDTGRHVHVHYHLTSRGGKGDGHPLAGFGRALPSYFHHYRRLVGPDLVWVSRGAVDTGDILESHARR